jgi:hypothetical protein
MPNIYFVDTSGSMTVDQISSAAAIVSRSLKDGDMVVTFGALDGDWICRSHDPAEFLSDPMKFADRGGTPYEIPPGVDFLPGSRKVFLTDGDLPSDVLGLYDEVVIVSDR